MVFVVHTVMWMGIIIYTCQSSNRRAHRLDISTQPSCSLEASRRSIHAVGGFRTVDLDRQRAAADPVRRGVRHSGPRLGVDAEWGR